MTNVNVTDKYGLNHQEINISTNLVSAYISIAKPSFKGSYNDYKKALCWQNDFVGYVRTIKGCGKIVTTKGEYELKENCVIFVHYQSCINFIAGEDGWEFYTVWFRINNFKVKLDQIFEIPLSETERNSMESIVWLLNTNNYINCCKANTFAQSIILDVHSKINDYSDSSPYEESMKKVALYISQNIDKNFLVADLAELCSFSKNHFFKVFKQFFKMSPKAYIRREKLKKAAFLLSSSSMQIEAIAEELSFYSPAHFSNCFKKIYKVTPSEFRHDSGMKGER